MFVSSQGVRATVHFHPTPQAPPRPAYRPAPRSASSAYNAYHKGGFQQESHDGDTVHISEAARRQAAQSQAANHVVGFAEANTGLATWNPDKKTDDAAKHFVGTVLGIGSIKHDIKTLGSNASTGDKIKAGLDLAGEGTTDLLLLTGEGEEIRGGELAGNVFDRSAAVGESVESKAGRVSEIKAEGTGKVLWGSWNDCEHVEVDGQTYAKVGDRLYSKHAVDRMQPSWNRFGHQVTTAGGDYGRSVSPNYVNHVIDNSRGVLQENGNYSHTLGSLQVIVNK